MSEKVCLECRSNYSTYICLPIFIIFIEKVRKCIINIFREKAKNNEFDYCSRIYS